jgi:Calcium binding
MAAPKIPLDPEREQRIADEAVVDCYNETERAMGWDYYLEQAPSVPFKARCNGLRKTSPLDVGDLVHVVCMAPEAAAWMKCGSRSSTEVGHSPFRSPNFPASPGARPPCAALEIGTTGVGRSYQY